MTPRERSTGKRLCPYKTVGTLVVPPHEGTTDSQMPTTRPTVYLIAQPTVSRRKAPPVLDDLYRHGEVQVVLPQGDSPTYRPNQCYTVMEERLANFDPDVDFLVWAGGDTLSAVMAGMILCNMDIWEFTWLRFDRDRVDGGGRAETGRYEPVKVDLRDPQFAMDIPPHEGADDGAPEEPGH